MAKPRKQLVDPAKFLVPAKLGLRLDDCDPASSAGVDKVAGKAALAALGAELEVLQELLYADGRHKLLIVLQGMDACGKDGTIRTVFDGVNPQGVRVANFKRPSDLEIAHDYLWRVHQQLPRSGEMTIFNRSHYEDVLVVRVHKLVPEARWQKRYDHIRAFEQMLADEGTTILKFFLHISKEEQRIRMQERLDDKSKHWKFAKADLGERKLWPAYMRAYEDALNKTSTEAAPWFVVPSDRNWFRDLVISQAIVDTLRGLDLRFPPPEPGLKDLVIE